MPTLTQLQELMNGADTKKAAEAAKQLANFYVVYNEEYNAWLKASHGAETALFKLDHDPNGADPGERLKLQSLQLRAEGRLKELDERMLAFHADAAAIQAPPADVIAKVKELSDAMSELEVQADAVDKIFANLTAIAEQTKGEFTAP